MTDMQKSHTMMVFHQNQHIDIYILWHFFLWRGYFVSTARFPAKIRKFEKCKKTHENSKIQKFENSKNSKQKTHENSKIRKFEKFKAKNARKLENSKIRKIQKMQKNARKLENSKIEKIQQQVRAFRWVGPGKKKIGTKSEAFPLHLSWKKITSWKNNLSAQPSSLFWSAHCFLTQQGQLRLLTTKY